MPNFILVDHSLRDTGGHHYPYAISVLEAAAAAGWAPALATHRDFAYRAAFPAHWPLHAIFPDVSYSTCTLDTQSRSSGRTSLLRSIAAPAEALLTGNRRRRHLRRFAAACRDFFAQRPLQDGDVVFLPTASELDLLGLAAYISSAGALPNAHWHAQLHFGIHRRRDWRRHGDTVAAAKMTESLRQSLRVLAPLPLHLWCTTDALSAQYSALGLAPFRTLPYPVHPLFELRRELRPAPDPARIACLGHARREKNQRLLPELLESLWPDGFDRGAVQLVVQNARAPLREALEARSRELHAAQPSRLAGSRSTVPVIDCSAGKLDQEHYAQLVCSSDIGLLLYDAQRYHDRCSGVLLEMLVAGVPVVVPARSWLADQLEQVNQSWLADCAARLRAERRLLALAPAQASTRTRWHGSVQQLPATPIGAVLFSMTWATGTLPGDGWAATVEQLDAGGRRLATTSLWMEAHTDMPVTWLLLPLIAATRAIAVRTAASPDNACEPLLEWVSGEAPPRAAIGLAIIDTSEAAGAIRDILQHIAHYKRHSAEFAVHCAVLCSSARIVAHLLEKSCAR